MGKLLHTGRFFTALAIMAALLSCSGTQPTQQPDARDNLPAPADPNAVVLSETATCLDGTRLQLAFRLDGESHHTTTEPVSYTHLTLPTNA